MNDHTPLDSQAQIEHWKPVPGYEDLYEVSDMGRVRSKGGRRRSKKNHILKDQPTKGGYRRVVLCSDGDQRNILVHRLVLLAFVGDQPEGKTQANHRNWVTDDNRLCNLEWVTPSQNSQHARKFEKRWSRGSDRYNARLSEADIAEIRRLHLGGMTQAEIGRVYNIGASHVSRIILRKQWKHVL